jgi:quinol monooxygenase YgiN
MFRPFALAGLAMTLLDSSPSSAQDAKFFTAIYIEAGPILARTAASQLRAFRSEARNDPGVVSLELLQRIDRPNQFVLLGAWTDQKTFESHFDTLHAKKLGDKIGTMLAAPNDIRQHAPLAVAPSRSEASALYVVTHVDVVPPQKDNAVAELKVLAEESRKQTGNLRFDVWQQVNRPNHFTVIEAWSSRGAFDLHQMQRPTKEFRGKLITMTGALYDERLYNELP